MSIPIDGTYSVPVSGPSPHLAMLRALYLKARGISRNTWAHARTTLTLAGQMPKSVAATVSSILSTQAGYTALTSTVRAVVRGAWNAVTTVARGVGKAARVSAGLVTLAVGYVSAPGADLTLQFTETIAERVTGIAQRIDSTIRGLGDLLWGLAHTTLVRSTVTVSASIASGVFVVHTLTQGFLAVKIVKAMPWLMTAMVWATDTWRTLALVGAAAIAAMALALVRLIHATQPIDDGPQWDPQPPTAAAGRRPVHAAPEPASAVPPMIDWEAVAASVRIEITNDGSVLVHGIPNSVPAEYGEVIAHIATDAALKHWRRTRTSRPCPSRDDRRLFTKAAKEAVRNHAQKHKQAA